ncbi:phosphoglucosamine mutase [beta proteobacterium AAP99]|nr:phosphoglucosamine mutase [beta proteobacterium AAP99]
MSRKYFGTDGVRGPVGTAPMTPDFVMRLGYAAGRSLAASRTPGSRPQVLIGKDTRVSGYLLEAALESGLIAAGADVLLAGPIPTPAVAHLTRAMRLDAGVVISASHNPYQDNGIKFFDGRGAKLSDETEASIEALIDEPMGCVASADLGKARRLNDAAGRYIEFCKASFPAHLDLRGLRVVVDCANGAAYQVTPALLHELGAEVIRIGCEPNGMNINDGVGAVHPQALQAEVREHGAHLGIALDGDADRLQMVDADGRLLNGDELLYVVAMDRHRTQPVEGVVGTLMSNFGLEAAFRSAGVGFERAKVGDRYVLERLSERGWLYGGESSGHLIFLDRHSTGDGTIAALQVLAAMRDQGRTLAELVAPVRLMPQVLKNVRLPAGFDWKTHAPLRDAQAAVEAQLGQGGRVLIRPSGTEPLLRLMVEAEEAQRAESLCAQLAASLPSGAAAAH